MTAEQLEELLGKVTQGEWEDDGTLTLFSGDKIIVIIADSNHNNYGGDFNWGEAEANARLVSLLPRLARRVIAAEKMAAAVSYDLSVWPDQAIEGSGLKEALTAYREASK